MTGVEFIQRLLDDPEELATDIADVRSAPEGGWLTSADVAEVRMDDGTRLLITVQEV